MSELLTLRDVATIMQVSEDKVARIFADMDGVIDLGRATGRYKRQYRILRIPKAVLEAYLSKKAGKTVTVKVPERPERRRKHDGWEVKATLNLAKAAKQNECFDKKLLREIADRARLFAKAVPESEWAEVLNDLSWGFDDEDPTDYEAYEERG
jgi:hypothetical protein